MHTLEIVDKLAFFQGLTDEEKETVSQLQMRIFRYHPGSIIIRKGDLDGDLFIILKGTATVVGSRSIPLAILKGGDVFGEVSFLAQGRARTADVVSNGEIIVIRLDQQAFASLDGPLREKLKDKLIKILIDRLVTPSAAADVSFNWTHSGPEAAG
ncbi:MAG: cyclic nucleotide-binding domain-containing protein [Magnetococcales bacterium]|nr:cyclic nucleotide-binding domain-containing protein [Magnetococcales bacterium]